MKEQLNDIKACILYLLFYQLNEANETNEPISLIASNEITSLVCMGYPDPTTITYDEDGVPLTTWQNPTFDCLAVYTLINWDPNFFTSPAQLH